MSNYRRNYAKGGTYCFTVNTYKKQLLLQGPAIDILRESFRECMDERPFKIEAIVILPDHLHCIWKLPAGDAKYPVRWKEIKSTFTTEYIKEVGKPPIKPSLSMQKKGEKGVWQRRYWEHTITDDEDYRRLFNYIHYNPVKHEWVEAPVYWPHSSFHRFVEKGIYTKWWAGPPEGFPEGMAGE
jgi:putative transposase